MRTIKSGLRRISRIWRLSRAQVSTFGRIKPGRDLVLGSRIRIGKGRTLTTGKRVFIGSDFHCMSNAIVGDDVMISSSVALVGDDHPFDDPEIVITDGARNPSPTVVVEGDNLIGYGTLIVGDIRICRGAIVAAGSLVTRDLTEVAVYAGRPAVAIRSRYRS